MTLFIDITSGFSDEEKQLLKNKLAAVMALSEAEASQMRVKVKYYPGSRELGFEADFGGGLRMEDRHRDALLGTLGVTGDD